MPTNYSVELTKEELVILKSLCPKGSALQRSLQMATIAAPIPLSVKIWRAACNFADNYSTNSIKEPLSWAERLQELINEFYETHPDYTPWDHDAWHEHCRALYKATVRKEKK